MDIEAAKKYIRNKIHESPCGCWLWQGAQRDGYGRASFRGIRTGAHRFSYLVYNGAFDKRLYVCHSCDTPDCVNPSHLFLGTQLDNMRDRDRKGRRYDSVPPTFRGERHGRASISNADATYIKGHYRPRDPVFGGVALAKQFDTSVHVISSIVCRKSWRHS